MRVLNHFRQLFHTGSLVLHAKSNQIRSHHAAHAHRYHFYACGGQFLVPKDLKCGVKTAGSAKLFLFMFCSNCRPSGKVGSRRFLASKPNLGLANRENVCPCAETRFKIKTIDVLHVRRSASEFQRRLRPKCSSGCSTCSSFSVEEFFQRLSSRFHLMLQLFMSVCSTGLLPKGQVLSVWQIQIHPIHD